MSYLPVDIWLIIFAYVDAALDLLDLLDADSLTFLWCKVRNVSHYLRDCIDEYFCHGVLQSMLVELNYSNINNYSGPSFAYVYVPMRFSHLSTDGTRAAFRQMAYISKHNRLAEPGSVRGWVPFAERYSAETRKPKPQVVRKVPPRSVPGPPAWEKEHMQLCSTLVGDSKTVYLASLRNHTSIGRGDRPPHYLKIRKAVNDTGLVDLSIDVDAREISFDWRRTFASFFVEQHYVMIAEQAQPSMDMQDYWNSSSRRARRRRARSRRLQDWFVANRHRLTLEDRLQAENMVEIHRHQLNHNLQCKNIRELTAGDIVRGEEEIVPEQCAEDFSYSSLWPQFHEDTEATPRKLRSGSRRCCLM
jgi:hypothetical protein